MKVYSVNSVWSQSISHGYEVVALFSTREKAEAHAKRCRIWQDEGNEAAAKLGSTQFHHDYEVEEWTIDEEAP